MRFCLGTNSTEDYPSECISRHWAAIYQHPTNILGVEVIANHLELISKSLPDS
jgi:hypothetical protein